MATQTIQFAAHEVPATCPVRPIGGGSPVAASTISEVYEGLMQATYANLSGDYTIHPLDASGDPLGVGTVFNVTNTAATFYETSLLEPSSGGGGGGGNVTVEDFTDEAMAELRSSLRGTLVVVRGPFIDTDDSPLPLRLVIGDDYLADDGRQIEFDIEGSSLPTTLVGATITLRLKSGKTSQVDVVEVVGSATVPTGDTRTIRFEPTAAETALLAETELSDGEYEVNIVDADGHEITPAELRGVLSCVSPLA